MFLDGIIYFLSVSSTFRNYACIHQCIWYDKIHVLFCCALWFDLVCSNPYELAKPKYYFSKSSLTIAIGHYELVSGIDGSICKLTHFVSLASVVEDGDLGVGKRLLLWSSFYICV
jgi:hypothetical protein